MLNSGKKIRAWRDKKINILTLVLSEKKILNETKNHIPPPPFQVKWSVPKHFTIDSNNSLWYSYIKLSEWSIILERFYLRREC